MKLGNISHGNDITQPATRTKRMGAPLVVHRATTSPSHPASARMPLTRAFSFAQILRVRDNVKPIAASCLAQQC